MFRGISPPYPEIPSIPSDIQQAIEDVRRFVTEVQSSVDVPEVLANLQNIAAGLDRIINSEEVERIFTGVERFVNSDDTQALTADLRAAIRDLRTTLADTRTLVNNAGAEVTGLAEKLDPVLEDLDAAIAQGAKVLADLDNQIGAESEVNHELINTLSEIQRAARSFRALTEYLERNPESLLRGKRD